jgi:(p)ppGpp synthase/HD superfamily hydrolase
VRTGKARSNIRHFLKTMQYEESASLGERLLEQALKRLKSSVAEIDDAGWDRALRDSGTRSRDELLADIGLGSVCRPWLRAGF